MFGRYRLWSYVVAWSLIFHETKVECTFKDVLNPMEFDVDAWHQRDTRVAIRNDGQPSCERRNIYICEEPPDTVPQESTKTCNFRNMEFHEQLFRWVAGRGCLLYTPDFLYVGGVNSINLSSGCLYGNLFAPCLEIAKEDGSCGCYPFDPGLEEVVNIVREALVPSAQGRWERCFYAARDCCSHYMHENITTDTDQCATTFDGWTCWQNAEAGTTSSEVCSEFAYSNTGPSCHHFSSKQCYPDGTWELQTDYSTCSIAPRMLRRYRFHIAMLSFSIASCLPAVFVFFFYKRLRITRVALHRNLLISIIVRNVLVIVSRSAIYIDELTSTGETTMTTHGLLCRILAVAERVAANAVFVCMLVEGLFLHRLIVAVFRQKLSVKWLYGIGAVIAIAPVVAWASVMGVHNDHSCWLVYTIEHVQWILDAPRVAILLVNTALFIDVLRVLLTKIRNSENANQLAVYFDDIISVTVVDATTLAPDIPYLIPGKVNLDNKLFEILFGLSVSIYRSTAKATLFLMPIFGTQFLLTAFRPNTTNCNGEQIYYYVAYTIEGLQGFVVAMLYCYVNKEVHVLIKATYKRTESAVVSRIRRDSNYPRMSNGPNSDRRMTYSTGLPSNNGDNDKDQYTIDRSKVHVAEIISIQASERLAEILEPVYETIQNGVTNEGYDSLERSDVDNDSGFIPNRNSKIDDYYNFTNASSVSIDCQDWIRCVSSPSSSVYNNSLNDYETKYFDKKFRNHPRFHEFNQVRVRKSGQDHTEDNVECKPPEIENTQKDISETEADIKDLEIEFSENMLDEIMQYIETNDNNNEVELDPELLAPNRKDGDKIIFIDHI